ncbi:MULTISPECIES: phage minor capsid protein [unclassified Microbacterium]|uniref:phage minor capsid protein n=1 Tax=unclassified Microbacterium TaxID=2609290 RepID=UPI003016C956
MALFVPDPERSLDDIIEDLAGELGRIYRDVEDELIREVAVRAARDFALAAQLPEAPAGRGLTVAERRRQNRILAELAAHRTKAARELQSIAAAMSERLRVTGLAQRIIDIASSEGEAAAAAHLGFAAQHAPNVIPLPGVAVPSVLGATASQASAMVAVSLQSRLEVLNQRITRYPQDAYQRVVAMYSPQTLLGVTTSRAQQAATVQRFLADGIPAFVDRSGRTWTVGAYSEMAGRTSVARAFNDAGIWRMQQSGINLVTITGGADACRKCAPWIGKILSTDGTTGTVTLPHATKDSTVTVEVQGTVDQARAAGWGHPNDRCRVVSYFAGLAIPQAGFQYDEAADKERQKQRELERDIRAAKRREASAMTDTDRRKAAREVRDAQAAMRDFTRDTGRKRQSYREQLRFADGRGGAAGQRPPQPRTPPTPLRALPSSMKPHEATFFRRMEARGDTLDWIAPDIVTRRATNDFRWTSQGGIEVELKSVNPARPGSRPNPATTREAIRKAVRTAFDNHAVVKENFIVDLGDRAFDEAFAAKLAHYNDNTDRRIRALWILASSGADLRQVPLHTKK